jgi:NADH dehydrogenase [ubiquinone] 1 alpha subcomplex assembly factor 7
VNGLKERLLRLIRAQGPLTIAQFMQIALGDPTSGYYMRRDPIGRDFITAPEISQMFGELIGLFFVQAWEERGRPGKFHLVELGPGRGTLMADLLRASQIRPGFAQSAEISLVEMSRALRTLQADRLGDHRIAWRREFVDVPDDAPLFLIANEFFDALPARQFIRSARGWHERMVSAEGETLVFAATPDCVPAAFIPPPLRDAPVGAIFETSPASQARAQEIARRIARNGGAALIVDYGHAEPGLGDTFQAVKAHCYADPLAEPGEADLTFHVDFAALAAAGREAGAAVYGPVAQGVFLDALGISARAERLKTTAPESADEIDAAIDRLTGAKQMGTLFKALAFAAPDTARLAGFSC